MRGDESSPSVTIDTEMLEIYLNMEYYCSFGETDDTMKNTSSIRKIKNQIGENLFNPVVVSIGPYHHEQRILQGMNQIKWNWMDHILKVNRKITLKDYIKSLKEVEHIARSYYTEEIRMESNEFVKMLVLDGIFILVSLLGMELNMSLDYSAPEEDSNNVLEQMESSLMMCGLLLIENQIPFFVLKIIYGLLTGENNTTSLSEKICYDMEQLLCQYPKSIKEANRPRNSYHLLHLCHMYMRPSPNLDFCIENLDPSKSRTVKGWHRALQYHSAGIQFKKREFNENNVHSLLDVRFSDNMLEIPNLRIDQNASSLFKNLVELEKTNLIFGNDITAYVIFMSQLVKDSKDVSLLASKGIIEHDLRGEEEIVDIFMRLGEGVTFDFTENLYLKRVCHDLEAYYQNRIKRWSVWFQQATSSVVHGWV